MKTEKIKCQVHLLPTENPTKIILDRDILELIDKAQIANTINSSVLGFHLYITNNEKPNIGDWVIEFQKNDTVGSVHLINSEYVLAPDIQKKIIATTDKSLKIEVKPCMIAPYGADMPFLKPSKRFIKHFIEQYNKGNRVFNVNVEFITNGNWEASISSGYSGRKCVNCSTWNYLDSPYVCNCGLSPKTESGRLMISFKEFWNRDEVVKLILDSPNDLSVHKWIEENV